MKVSAEFVDEPASPIPQNIMDWLRLLDVGRTLRFVGVKQHSIYIAMRRLGLKCDMEVMPDGAIKVTRKQ